MKTDYIKILNSFPEDLFFDISFLLKDYICHDANIVGSDILMKTRSQLTKVNQVDFDKLIEKIHKKKDSYSILEAINNSIYNKTKSKDRRIKNKVNSILKKFEAKDLDENIEIEIISDKSELKKEIPKFKAGDTITVNYKVKEGNKERAQKFMGVVLQGVGSGPIETFTVRKISGNVGVERIFPISSPFIEAIVVNKIGVVRRARIFYFRKLKGKSDKFHLESKKKKK